MVAGTLLNAQPADNGSVGKTAEVEAWLLRSFARFMKSPFP
jgi:hypothetical protein